MATFDSDRFKVHEIDVTQDGDNFDSHLERDSATAVRPEKNRDTAIEEVRYREDQWEKRLRKKSKKPYAPYMFLSCLFLGVGMTATFDVPIFLFAGLSAGFLSFVDPVYDKIMDKLDKL